MITCLECKGLTDRTPCYDCLGKRLIQADADSAILRRDNEALKRDLKEAQDRSGSLRAQLEECDDELTAAYMAGHHRRDGDLAAAKEKMEEYEAMLLSAGYVPCDECGKWYSRMFLRRHHCAALAQDNKL